MSDARTRDILRVLCRLAIPRGQLVLYKLSLLRRDTGFGGDEIRAAIHYDKGQLYGLTAALARRINETPREMSSEKVGLSLLFGQRWQGDDYHYTPRSELLAAITQLPSLESYLSKTMEEIVAARSHTAALPNNIPADPVLRNPLATKIQKLPFHHLLQHLDEGGLYFPGETVANVLLALQVKRFVLLTGISGTGKTRVAQAIAERFQLTRQIVVPQTVDERSVVIEVSGDAHTKKRLVLPAVLAIQMPAIVQQQGSGTIKVRWPKGETEVATYKHRSDRPSGLVVLMSGVLAQWFSSNFQAGAKLRVGIAGSSAGFPDTITLALPGATVQRSERVPNAEIIAVRPDWTDNRGLLGFYNPLTREYVTTPFLRLLLAADDEARRAAAEQRSPHPFFVVLDEMNLARVEHYFSDLLSTMESVADDNGGVLHLHEEDGLESESDGDAITVPRSCRIPPNLFIVGTVNVDESTYMFSPKVLDRAFTIEFNAVDLSGLELDSADGGELDLVSWDGTLPPPKPPTRDDWRWLVAYRDRVLGEQVHALHGLLASANRHFGYRVACEIARFVKLAVEQTGPDESSTFAAARAALDIAILQKVLVKLAGTQAELARIIDELLWFMLAGKVVPEDARDPSRWRLDAVEGEVVPADEASEDEPAFPRSAAKLWRMQQRLRERGFTSWIE